MGLTMTHAPKGLEGVVATTSKICYIDGDNGVLAYGGIDIHELAEKSNFEETCFLLWHGKLPNADELKDTRERLAAERKLDPAVLEFLRSVPKEALPMDVLRTAVSLLGLYDRDEKSNDHDANVSKAIRLTSQIAMIVAAFDRVRKGKKVVDPDPSLSHAANFLLLLNGEKPSETAERALDIALILHADHELNASTFAARVTAATLSDMHSAVTSAIGALRGPSTAAPTRPCSTSWRRSIHWCRSRRVRARDAGKKKKISGFGHRVYHTEDPRATHLRRMSEDLCQSSGQPKWFEMSQQHREVRKSREEAQRQRGFLFGIHLSRAGHRC